MRKFGMILLALCALKCAGQSEWKTSEGNLLRARSFAGSIALNGKIYIFGGGDYKPPSNNVPGSWKSIYTIEVYDPVSKTCMEKSTLAPVCISKIVVDQNDLFYAMAGNELYTYNINNDEFRKKAVMPTPPRDQICVALIGDSLYVIGGDNHTAPDRLNYAFDVYVISKNKWFKKPNMSTSVRNSCAVVFNSKIYVIGGHGAGNNVLEYNPQNGRWTRKANMPTPRTDLAVEVLNGKIYAIGGHPGIPTVEEYNPMIDSWKKMANMPAGRCFHSSAVVNNRIYILGGAKYSDQPNNYNSIESFSPNTITGHSYLP